MLADCPVHNGNTNEYFEKYFLFISQEHSLEMQQDAVVAHSE
jgi:hypothetical protein